MMTKQDILLEVLEQMEPRIQAGLRQTTYQEQEDLKQDMYVQIVQAAERMEPITFWEFKERFDQQEQK